MEGDTICSFVSVVDIYFGLTGIFNEWTKHKFTSLLLIEDAANCYDTRNYTFNATWGTLKSDLLSWYEIANLLIMIG